MIKKIVFSVLFVCLGLFFCGFNDSCCQSQNCENNDSIVTSNNVTNKNSNKKKHNHGVRKSEVQIIAKNGFLNIIHDKNTSGYDSKILRVPVNRVIDIRLYEHWSFKGYKVSIKTNEENYSYERTKVGDLFSPARYGSVLSSEKDYQLDFNDYGSAKRFFNEISSIIFDDKPENTNTVPAEKEDYLKGPAQDI